jgi:uncharacterized protein YjiK
MNYNLLVSIAFISLLLACNPNNSNKKKTPVIVELPENKSADTSITNAALNSYSYNLKNPTHSWKLPAELVEVSGNTWVDKDHLLLIEDIHPNLYYVKIDDKNATLEKSIPFASEDKEKFDIEDVTLINNTVYALWSHGTIFKITNWQNKPQVEKIKTFLTKENNTEGLCYDPVTQLLLIACKDASGLPDEKKSTKAVYQFDMKTNEVKNPPFLVIQKDDFISLTNQKLHFNPSAIAVHPVTHEVYILSTRDNKCMAVFTHSGAIKSFQFINADLMPQPEGICFSPDGKLYISSEGKKGEPGNLFEFDPYSN